MVGKFVVSLTHAKDDAERATVAFVVANAALGSDQETVVFLSVEGVRLSQKGYADDIHETGFAPLKELMGNFVQEGGKIYACSSCFKKRNLDGHQLVGGSVVVGGAKLVEFMASGCPSVSY
jgi:predicted peroxiredoxin